MSDYALGYARAGFRVFPLHSMRDGACSCGNETCQSQGKHPRTKNGFKDATIEPETIQQWWQKWPDANIGIATGVAIGASEGLYVIDIDTAKGATVEPSEKCPKGFSTLLEQSLSVRTGSGGYHIYLSYDIDLFLKNTQGELGTSIDTRGQGGYVVAPPSSNQAGRYTWLNRCPIQPIPEDLLSVLRLSTSFRDFRKEKRHDQLSHPAQTGATQETAARPANAPAAATDGTAAQTSLASKGRNDFLMKLGGFYRKQGLDIAEIRVALLNANEEFFGHGRNPKGPLALEELERTVLYTLAKKQAEEGIVKQVERRVRFRDDSYYENQPPREWLIENHVPLESVVLTFGASGSGKSFLIMDWSMCIGTGIPWQGRKVSQGPVAYISAEGGAGLRARIKAWKAKHGYVGESGVKWFDETLVLHDAGNFNELLTAFEQDFIQPPVLVILDTLSRCSGGAEENSNTEMAKVIAAADALQQRFHCSILIVHHAGKDSDRGPRGASALIGNTETIIAVDRTDHGCRVSCFKQKDAAKFEAFSLKFETVQFGPEAGDTSVVLVADSENSQPALRQSESVMLALLTNAEEGGMTFTEWKEAGIVAGLKERTASQAIKDLRQNGQVVKKGRKYLQREEVKDEGELFSDENAAD